MKSLEDAVLDALTISGIDVLSNPKRLLSIVMDVADNASAEMRVFSHNCDDELLAPFREAARLHSAEAIAVAVSRGCYVLHDDRAIQADVARSVCGQLGSALSRFLNIGAAESRQTLVSAAAEQMHPEQGMPSEPGDYLAQEHDATNGAVTPAIAPAFVAPRVAVDATNVGTQPARQPVQVQGAVPTTAPITSAPPRRRGRTIAVDVAIILAIVLGVVVYALWGIARRPSQSQGTQTQDVQGGDASEEPKEVVEPMPEEAGGEEPVPEEEPVAETPVTDGAAAEGSTTEGIEDTEGRELAVSDCLKTVLEEERFYSDDAGICGISIVENAYSDPIDVDATFSFLDEAGNTVRTVTYTNYGIAPGRRTLIHATNNTLDGQPKANHVEFSYAARKSDTIPLSWSVHSYEWHYTEEGLEVTIENGDEDVTLTGVNTYGTGKDGAWGVWYKDTGNVTIPAGGVYQMTFEGFATWYDDVDVFLYGSINE